MPTETLTCDSCGLPVSGPGIRCSGCWGASKPTEKLTLAERAEQCAIDGPGRGMYVATIRAALEAAVAQRDKEFEALFAATRVTAATEAVAQERAALREAHKGRTVIGRASDGCETDWSECEICKVETPCPTLIALSAPFGRHKSDCPNHKLRGGNDAD